MRRDRLRRGSGFRRRLSVGPLANPSWDGRGAVTAGVGRPQVFENINIVGAVGRTLGAMQNLDTRVLKKEFTRVVATAGGDGVAVIAFYFLLDPALRAQPRGRGSRRRHGQKRGSSAEGMSRRRRGRQMDRPRKGCRGDAAAVGWIVRGMSRRRRGRRMDRPRDVAATV